MDSSSSNRLDQLATKKQLAVYLVGSASSYQNYKKTQQIQKLYPHDLHYFNDTFYYRHDRNIAELKQLIQFIKQGKIIPEMLIYNTWNSFYPSYVLNHHYQIYCQILKLFAKNKEVNSLLEKALKLEQIGFYTDKIIHSDFGKSTQGYIPTLNKKGQIEMSQNYYYFDKHVSLYYQTGSFLVKKQNETVLVFVNLRDQKGDLNKQIHVQDFGQRISSQYLQIGYNFNKIKPFLAIKLDNDIKVKQIFNTRYFSQFNLSLLDLRKSLFLAIKYTKMRLQFKTLPDSKAQRPIISYQAVGIRIVNAISKLLCFADLNRGLMNNKAIIPFAAPLLDINHKTILESVIRLRQCCGGFGYLQVAGHGGCIERLALRSSQCFLAEIPQNPQILKRLHYYSSSDDMQSYFGDMLTKQNAFNPIQIFSVFINICVNMRKSCNEMRKDTYLRHFLHQAAIQSLKVTQQFSRLPRESYIFQILFYECACYIIENGSFINWKFIDSHLSKQQYFRGVQTFKNNSLNQLIQKIPYIQEVLQVNHVRNSIVGRQNSEQFYDQVLLASKNNLRNSEEFLEYVKRPIVEFLVQNNAKL